MSFALVVVLQEDLSKMTEWSKKWLMRFNAKKCHVMRLKRSRQNIVSINNYNIDGSTLEEVEHRPFQLLEHRCDTLVAIVLIS
jgi:hypothetical protein